MNKQTFAMLILLGMLAACAPATQPTLSAQPPNPTTQSPTISSTPTQTPRPSDTPQPTPTRTPTPTTAPSATPAAAINLNRFDPDLHPAIDVLHNAPELTRLDETVPLAFDFVCGYMFEPPGFACNYEVTLFYTYGQSNEFTALPLKRAVEDEVEVWAAQLPAADAAGRSLRYYLQVYDPQIGLAVRYPLAGTFDVFTVTEFIPVEFPEQQAVQPGELVLALPWGSGPEAVGLQQRAGYPSREGPVAIAVAEDGRIALLDHVNGRILIYNPSEQSFASLPLPFQYSQVGSALQFDREGQLAVLDAYGGPGAASGNIRVPRIYRLNPDGSIRAVAPVFAALPGKINRDLEVLDDRDGRWLSPFGPNGEPNSRQAQREKRTQELPYRYIENMDPYVSRFGDVAADLAFEVHSVSPLGAITDFERTPHGYLATFSSGDQIRAVWFDASGQVLQDVSLPNEQYSEVYFLTQVAIGQEGSIYVLGSTPRGVNVRFVPAP
jgi:hypothetical protein